MYDAFLEIAHRLLRDIHHGASQQDMASKLEDMTEEYLKVKHNILELELARFELVSFQRLLTQENTHLRFRLKEKGNV